MGGVDGEDGLAAISAPASGQEEERACQPARGSRLSALGSRLVRRDAPVSDEQVLSHAGVGAIVEAMQDFRKVRAWQAAHRATLLVYRISTSFPRSEQFGLTAQLRDSASSVGANIAEGCGRSTDADRRRCYGIAFASACETLNHLVLARDLGYLAEADYAMIEAEARPSRQMLIRLIERIEADTRSRASRKRLKLPRAH